jgi:hypothetical protein
LRALLHQLVLGLGDAAAGGGLVPYAVFFLAVSLVVSVVTSAIRIQDPVRIAVETQRFFFTIVAVIAAFGIVVFVLEWIFIRPPL